MPYPLAHSLAGLTVASATRGEISLKRDGKLLLLVPTLSLAPDFDFLLVFLTGDPSYHRHFTHSILFAAITGLLLARFLREREKIRSGLVFAAVMLSHGILDCITTPVGSGGPMLLWPFSWQRFAALPREIAPLLFYPSFQWMLVSVENFIIASISICIREMILFGPLLLGVILIKMGLKAALKSARDTCAVQNKSLAIKS